MRKDARHHTLQPLAPLETPIFPDDLKSEIHAWSAKLDVRPLEIRILPMSRKWASCSARGRVTFDTDLLSQPERFRREVIVHELLHLRIPNHGPLFRALISVHLSGRNANHE